MYSYAWRQSAVRNYTARTAFGLTSTLHKAIKRQHLEIVPLRCVYFHTCVLPPFFKRVPFHVSSPNSSTTHLRTPLQNLTQQVKFVT